MELSFFAPGVPNVPVPLVVIVFLLSPHCLRRFHLRVITASCVRGNIDSYQRIFLFRMPRCVEYLGNVIMRLAWQENEVGNFRVEVAHFHLIVSRLGGQSDARFLVFARRSTGHDDMIGSGVVGSVSEAMRAAERMVRRFPNKRF
jgi:hypothetical protein